MKRISLKQLILGGVVFTVATLSIVGTSSAPQYRTTTIEETSVKKEIDFTTNWYPLGYAKVGLGASSNIKQVRVKTGSSVKKNDVLAQLTDDTEYNQYKSAQAAYIAAIRAKKSAESTPMTPQSTIDSLQGQINSAYYQMKNAEVNLNKKKVKSPITGTVIDISISDYSESGSSSLTPSLTGSAVSSSGNFIVVANSKDASFTTSVSERDIAKLTPDMKVSITTRVNSEILTGKIVKLAKTPTTDGVEDPTYFVTIKLDTYPKFAFGTKMEGSILTTYKEKAQAIQIDAITVESSTTGSVLVLSGDGKVETKKVTIGAVGDEAVEVTGGVNQSTNIVVDQLPDKKVITLRPWLKKLLGINQ